MNRNRSTSSSAHFSSTSSSLSSSASSSISSSNSLRSIMEAQSRYFLRSRTPSPGQETVSSTRRKPMQYEILQRPLTSTTRNTRPIPPSSRNRRQIHSSLPTISEPMPALTEPALPMSVRGDETPPSMPSLPSRDCPICFESIATTDIQYLPCFHSFHSSCIDRAMASSSNPCCPICIHVVTDTNNSADNAGHYVVSELSSTAESTDITSIFTASRFPENTSVAGRRSLVSETLPLPLASETQQSISSFAARSSSANHPSATTGTSRTDNNRRVRRALISTDEVSSRRDDVSSRSGNNRRGGRGGVTRGLNYSDQMISKLLDYTEIFLPMNIDEWPKVSDKLNLDFPDNPRDSVSVKKKFQMLYLTKPRSGETEPSINVRRAKVIRELIIERSAGGMGPDDDLIEDILPSSNDVEDNESIGIIEEMNQRSTVITIPIERTCATEVANTNPTPRHSHTQVTTTPLFIRQESTTSSLGAASRVVVAALLASRTHDQLRHPRSVRRIREQEQQNNWNTFIQAMELNMSQQQLCCEREDTERRIQRKEYEMRNRMEREESERRYERERQERRDMMDMMMFMNSSRRKRDRNDGERNV